MRVYWSHLTIPSDHNQIGLNCFGLCSSSESDNYSMISRTYLSLISFSLALCLFVVSCGVYEVSARLCVELMSFWGTAGSVDGTVFG